MQKLLFVFVLIPSLISAQKLDSLVLDTTRKPPPSYYRGIFFDIKGLLGSDFSEINLVGSYGIGIQYEKWIIGFSRFYFAGNAESRVVFPNLFKLNYVYGGLYIAFSALKTNSLSCIFTVGYYKGDMTWQRDEDEKALFRDKFTIIKGSFTVELSKFRYAKPYLSVGFQQVQDLDLVNVKSKDFSGIFIEVGIRTGYFNQ